MARYLIQRVLQAIWVLWAAFTISFIVLFLLPADPVSIAADGGATGTPVDQAAIAELQARYGLDRPLWEQYWTALTHAAHGDLGTSIATGRTVTGAIADALPQTLALAGLALLFAVVGGVALAFAATYPRSAWLRDLLGALPSVGVSLPTFWVGLLLLQVFSFGWRLTPAFGGQGFSATVLPAITLAIPIGAVIAQVLASGLRSTARQPFVAVAKAKGGSRWWVQRKHVLRPASVPTFTVAGVLIGNMLAGSVVVETVFARQGIGRLTQTSVLAQDIPVVQGIVLLTSVVFVSVNLVVDLLYPLLDPRIAARVRGPRRGGAGGTDTDTVSTTGPDHTGPSAAESGAAAPSSVAASQRGRADADAATAPANDADEPTNSRVDRPANPEADAARHENTATATQPSLEKSRTPVRHTEQSHPYGRHAADAPSTSADRHPHTDAPDHHANQVTDGSNDSKGVHARG
ncbi:hypothetical protein GCM10023318_38420 [Nocardia callitridis]|uniref:ABC transmembrane type-1 domain-containing protein n=1 Tax=Nocardia callitridis TaxID=648753 RepID=A0ABP9KHA6_9NOCA